MIPKKLFAGAGGGPKQPTSTPDTLKSEDVVEFALALSEGPIRGLVDGAKSFYIGETALLDAQGNRNFDKFAIGVHPGYPEGSAQPLKLQLGGVTSGQTVSVAMLSGVLINRTTDGVARGVIDELEVRIRFDRLVRADDGGTFTADAVFQIQYKKTTDSTWLNFYGTQNITINGKTTSGYIRDFKVTVPRVTDADWQVRVMKVSANSPLGDKGTFIDLTFDSLQWTTKGDATFADTAIVHAIGVSNGQFSSIPDFTGVYDGLLCRVPTNYNPDLRTWDESVPWNGTFKFAWTNNPALILYEMIVNPRFGLASARPYLDANRYDFYLAAKWCDQLVGTPAQPRYTFNAVISEPRGSMEMLNYIAGSFNSLVWDDLGGQIHLRVDRNDPAQQLFTPENVTIEGFGYTFTDINARANEITVTYINPELDWNEDKRCIPGETTNEAAIARFGRIPLEFIAVGCTNTAEAIRKARLRLISAQTETAMVSFTTTLQGSILSLYDVILVADPVMGWSQSGRISSTDATWINVRDAIYVETMKSYVLKLQTPEGIFDINVQPEATGLCKRFRWLNTLPANIPAYTVFTIEEENGFGYAKPFRVMSIEEVDGSPYLFKISGMEINRYKYDDSDNGTLTEEFDYSFKNPTLPGVPTNFALKSGDTELLIANGTVTPRILASWRRPLSIMVREYELQCKIHDDSEWTSITVLGESSYISPVSKGAHYDVRVRSINDETGNASGWATITDYAVAGKAVLPTNVTSFAAVGDLFQIKLSWVFVGVDISKIEIWAANTNSFVAAAQLTDLSYPTSTWTHMGLDMGRTVYYWYRVKDTSGNYSAFNPTVVSATTVTSPSKIVAALQNSITETELYADLKTRIGQIDGPAGTLGTVNQRIKVEADARIAAVAQEAQDRADAILAEAQARGTAISDERLVWQAGDQQVAQQITTLTAGSIGLDTAKDAAWYFDTNVESWTTTGGTQAWNAGAIEVTGSGDQNLISPANLTIDGSKYPLVKARVKRLAGTTGWDGKLYYQTSAQGAWSESFMKQIPVPSKLAVGDPAAILEFDMSTLPTWNTGTITRLRLDLSNTANDKFSIDWIAVGRVAPSASLAALQQEATTRASQDQTNADAILALATTVNNPTTGLVQTRAELTTNYATKTNLTDATTSLTNSLRSSWQGDDTATLNAAKADTTSKLTGYTNTATLVQDYATKTSVTSSISTATQGLATQWQSDDDGVYAAAQAYVTTYSYSKSQADSAFGTRIDTVTARLDTAGGGSSAATYTANFTWGFATTVEGWVMQGTGTSGGAGIFDVQSGAVRLYGTYNDTWMLSPSALNLNGTTNKFVRMSIKRVAGSGWEGGLRFITNADSTWNDVKYKQVANTVNTSGYVTVEWDMTNVSGWNANTISQLRLDLGNTTADQFLIDWIDYGFKTASTSGVTIEQALTAQATLNTGYSAQYSVKVDNNGYISGFGLSSTANNSTPTSTFIVNADKFAIVMPGKTSKTPFVVGTVNGVSAVGIDGALAVDGSIAARSINTNGLVVRDNAGTAILSAGVGLANVPINGMLAGLLTQPNANILKNSTFRVGWYGWQGSTAQFGYTQGGNEGYYAYCGMASGTWIIYQDVTLYGNADYTLSAELVWNGSGGGPYMGMDVECYNSSNTYLGTIAYIQKSGAAATGWTRLSGTGRTPNGTNYGRVRMYCVGYQTPNSAFRRIKLEQGTSPSPYSEEASTALANWSETQDTGGKPVNYADVTSQNTAARVAGQGGWATLQEALYSWNINTWMGDVAINGAKIGYLEIDTIRLRNNSICNLDVYGLIYAGSSYAGINIANDGYGSSMRVQFGGYCPGNSYINSNPTEGATTYYTVSSQATLQIKRHGDGAVMGSITTFNGYATGTIDLAPGDYYLTAVGYDVQGSWILKVKK